MLYEDSIEKLIGIKGLIVEDAKNVFGELHIFAKMQRQEHICPCCGAATNRIHDYRSQIVKDIEAFGQATFIHLKKRRQVYTAFDLGDHR